LIPLAFRRGKVSIVAERHVIPAKAGIQEKWIYEFWMPDQVRHDEIVDINQPI
jgi:hypothetical protein